MIQYGMYVCKYICMHAYILTELNACWVVSGTTKRYVYVSKRMKAKICQKLSHPPKGLMVYDTISLHVSYGKTLAHGVVCVSGDEAPYKTTMSKCTSLISVQVCSFHAAILQ